MISVRIHNFSSNPDPTYAHEDDAGFDLYSNEDVFVGGSSSVLVDVGIRIDIPKRYEGQIRLRSSYAKKGIIIPNSPGTIDSGYKGPVMVAIRNLNTYQPFHLKKGERFAQIVINELPSVNLVTVSKDEFFKEKSSRSNRGFGSTGNF